jgi:uncharacterized protein (DUF1778 family)
MQVLTEQDQKTARVDFRVAPHIKTLLEQAAQAKGMSLSAYIISTLVNNAKETVDREQRISLTNRDAEIFARALEAEPNEQLVEAAKRYRKDQEGVDI